MRVIGRVVATERPVADFVLRHGDDPARALARRGFVLERPIRARLADGEIELIVHVRPTEPAAVIPSEPVPREHGVPAGAIPVVRQRIAAYALVDSVRGLLATEFSDRTNAPGRWGLPGGGIDDGEEPEAAVLREIVEETGQQARLDELVAVDSNRWIGTNPHGVVEDFQSVRLVYRAHCPEPFDPVVLDVGGTTSDARWITREDWESLNWSAGWRRLVADLLAS